MKKVLFFLSIFLFCCNFDDNPPDKANEGFLFDNEYKIFLLDSLSKAQSEIMVMMFVAVYFPEREYEVNEVFKNLKLLKENGIQIKMLLDKTNAIDYPETTNFLTQNNIDFKLYNSAFSLHSKMVIIDRSLVIFGSHNWTEAAFSYNKEVSFYIAESETVEKAISYFNGLYNEIK